MGDKPATIPHITIRMTQSAACDCFPNLRKPFVRNGATKTKIIYAVTYHHMPEAVGIQDLTVIAVDVRLGSNTLHTHTRTRPVEQYRVLEATRA